MLIAEGALLIEVLEVVSGLLLAGRDVAVLVDVDLALALQLEHQSLGLLEVGCHGVELDQLRLGSLEEVHLRLHVRLLRGGGDARGVRLGDVLAACDGLGAGICR